MDYQSRLREIQQDYQQQMRLLQDEVRLSQNQMYNQNYTRPTQYYQQQPISTEQLPITQETTASIPVPMQQLNVLGEIKALLVELRDKQQNKCDGCCKQEIKEEVKQIKTKKENEASTN